MIERKKLTETAIRLDTVQGGEYPCLLLRCHLRIRGDYGVAKVGGARLPANSGGQKDESHRRSQSPKITVSPSFVVI